MSKRKRLRKNGMPEQIPGNKPALDNTEEATAVTSTVTQKEKDLENQLKKALADYQNLKRDMERRLEFEGQIARKEMLRSIVELADDIDLAIDHVNDEKGWREGVGLILEKFRKVIAGIGAEMIECKEGDVFNPDVHEAVGIVCEGEDNTVAKVVQNGYVIGPVLVRPVRVIVNKHKINTNNHGKNSGD